MAIDTYLKFRAALCNTINKDDISASITAFEGMTIDSMAKLATERATLSLQRDLISRGGHKNMEAVSTSLTLTGGTNYVDLPTDFAGLRMFQITTNPTRVLEFTDPNSLFGQYGGQATNTPEKYTIIGTRRAYLGPTPDSSYTTLIVYLQTLTALSADADTNWLLTGHWDIYECAAMLELCIELENDERLQFWKGHLDQKMNDLMGDDRNVRWAATPTMPNLQVAVA